MSSSFKLDETYDKIKPLLLESLIEDDLKEKKNDYSINDSFSESKEIISSEQQKTIFDDFVVLLDNPIEYKKELLKSAKKKIWKVVKLIKKNNNLKNLYIYEDSKPCFIINSGSKRKKIFKGLIYILLYIDYILLPYELFVGYDKKIIINRCIIFDIIFLIEILIKFISSYYDYKNKFIVTNIRLIFWKNINLNLFISLFSIFPFYLFNIKLEITRLIKLYRYPIFNSKLKNIGTTILSPIIKNIILKQQIMRIFSLFLSLCYILHFCACIYCLLGKNYSNSWILIHKEDLNSKNNFQIYINSIYFMAETFSTTGYGDLCPYDNEEELLFLIFCEIVNCAFYAYLLSNILEIITKGNSLTYQIKSDHLDLERWIIHYINRLPASAKKKYNLHRSFIWNDVKRFFEIYYSNERNLKWIKKNINFIKEMKPKDKNKLFEHAFKRTYDKYNKFFRNILKNNTKQEIILNFDISIEMSDTIIIPFEGKINRIYFIEQGTIEILNEENKIINILKEGDFFGIEKLTSSYNGKSNYIYKVGKNCNFCILNSIKISYLIDNIFNYDGEAFKIFINLAIFYSSEILHENINHDTSLIINNHTKLNFAGNIPNLLNKIQNCKNYILKCNLIQEKIERIKKQIQEIQ